MILAGFVVVSVIAGVVTGLLIRINYENTDPVRYRKRWGVRPAVSAIAISLCFSACVGSIAIAVFGGDELQAFNSIAPMALWGAVAIAMCLPPVWRLAIADLRRGRNPRRGV